MRAKRPAARLALRTRLAIFISAGIMLAGLALVLFLNLALQNSLSRKPALLVMAPKTVFIKTFAIRYDAHTAIKTKNQSKKATLTGTITISKADEPSISKSAASSMNDNDTAPAPLLSRTPEDGEFTVRLFSAGNTTISGRRRSPGA